MKKRKSFWPLALAIALNSAILAALFWSFHMEVPSAGDTPMQAQLSSGMPPVATPTPQQPVPLAKPVPAPKPAPKPVPAPTPKPVPVPKPAPPPSAARIAAEKAAQEKVAAQKAAQITAEKQAAEKRAEELAARAAHKKAAQRAAAQKAATQKAAAQKAAAEKQAAQKAAIAQRAAALKQQQAKAAEAARAKALQQQMEARAKLQAEANMAAALAKQAAENQRLSALFGNQIGERVKRHWQPVFAPNLHCQVRIKLSPQGQLEGDPAITQSSGNAQFDSAVIAAIKAAAPFPPPIGLSYSEFKVVNIVFSAKELSNG